MFDVGIMTVNAVTSVISVTCMNQRETLAA